MTKRYDRAYFDKWYRSDQQVNSRSEIRRKVTLALAVAEYFLRRRVRSVLDIGCGEGAWLAHLRALRADIDYTGLDPSEYVVERFGKARNIRRAGFGELPRIRLRRSFDLVVCSDVLHYVGEDEIEAGVSAITRLTHAVAYLEVLTREDEVVGDLTGLIQRPAGYYRTVFTRAGLVQAGPYCWMPRALRLDASELEIMKSG